MTKSRHQWWLTPVLGMPLVLVLFILSGGLGIYFFREFRFDSKTIDCKDPEGPRPVIPISDFVVNYSTYTAELEVQFSDKGKYSAKIGQSLATGISDALLSGREFRKAIVAGYSHCAISRSSYEQSIRTYQAFDGIARQIGAIVAKPNVGPEEKRSLELLVAKFTALSESMANIPK